MRRTNFALVAVYLLLAWAGNAAVLVYERFDYGFGSPVSLLRLPGQMVSIGLADVVGNYFGSPDFQFVNLAMLVTAVVALGLATSSMRNKTKALIAVAMVTAPLGLVGFLSMALTIGHRDGEWLAEGWPMLEVFFYWSVALIGFAYANRKRTSQPITV